MASEVRSPDRSRSDVLIVDGMFCAACAAGVQSTLARQPGVTNAAVNFAADAAVIEWTPDGRDIDELLQAVRRLGYRARTIDALDASQSDRDGPSGDLMRRLAIAIFFGMWTMLPSLGLYFGADQDPVVGMRLAIAAGAFSLPVVLYSGLPFYRMGLLSLRSGTAGIDALVTFGVAGSLLLSVINLVQGDPAVYFEVPAALIALQLIARLLDLRAGRRARDAVVRLLALAPPEVTLVGDDGSEQRVALADVRDGDVIALRPGERAALDGRILSGTAHVDRSLLTGESAPVLLGQGDMLHAGETVIDGALAVTVTAANGRRRVDELARQVRRMLAAKGPWQRIAEAAARYFLYLSAAAAALAGVGVLLAGHDVEQAALRALAVFVIACPCALSLAAPLAALRATVAGAVHGIVLRDLTGVTDAALPDLIFFDKTGTLTQGRPRVVAVHAFGDHARDDVLALAARAEQRSEHPIAHAIRSAGPSPDDTEVDAAPLRVVPGGGVIYGEASGAIRVGSPRWLADEGLTLPALPPTDRTRVIVAQGDVIAGAIDLDDELRPEAQATIAALRQRGIEAAILSGDNRAAVERIAARLGIAGHAELTPEDKVTRIEEARAGGAVVAFVGDGLNDGPALAAADLGVAVGGATDVATTAAAAAFSEPGVAQLTTLLDLTRRARNVVRQNLAWAIVYNVVALPAAMLGWVHPAIAAVAMALSSIAVVVNSLRVRIGDSLPLTAPDSPTTPTHR